LKIDNENRCLLSEMSPDGTRVQLFELLGECLDFGSLENSLVAR